MHVLNHLGSGDLASVSLVSRALHASVEPVLYRTISWNWNPIPRVQVLQVFRAILGNPGLALQIKQVSMLSAQPESCFGPWEAPVYGGPNWEDIHNAYGGVVKQAQEIVINAAFPDTAKWAQALQNGNTYALVAVLLSQLHNLQSVQLDYSFIWQGGFPGLMLKHALFSTPENSLSKFDSLTVADYGGNVTGPEFIDFHVLNFTPHGLPGCDPDQFMAWFHLPSINSLSIWLRSFKDVLTMDSERQIRNLHTLVLARSTIEEGDIACLLSKAFLKTLHLGLAYLWGGDRYPLINGTSIMQAMQLQSQCEKLSMSLEWYPATCGFYWFDEEDAQLREPWMGSFKHFTTLSSAEIPITLLLGLNPENSINITQVLPNTLQELCLHWDNAGMGGNDWEFESQFRDCIGYLLQGLPNFPHLKRISFRMWIEMAIGREWEEWESLKQTCLLSGIELSVVADHLSPGLWTNDAFQIGDHEFEPSKSFGRMI